MTNVKGKKWTKHLKSNVKVSDKLTTAIESDVCLDGVAKMYDETIRHVIVERKFMYRVLVTKAIIIRLGLKLINYS